MVQAGRDLPHKEVHQNTENEPVMIELEGLSSGEHYQGSIDTIAKKIGYNKEYMCRHFSEEIGIGITEFLMLLRIEKAKELLTATDYQICQIAEMVGYSSESYFIRLFRKNIGISPLRYRYSHMNHI